jgi:hypothetical protein
MGMVAAASLTTHSISTQVASVSLTGVAALGDTGVRVVVGVINLTGTTNLISSAHVALVASVQLVGSTTLVTAPVITRHASVLLAGSGALIASAGLHVIASVPLFAQTGLITAGVTTRLDVVTMSATAFQEVVGQTVKVGVLLPMSASTSMSVAAAPVQIFAQVTMAAATSLTVPGLVGSAAVYLRGNTTMTMVGGVHEYAAVALVGASQLIAVTTVLTHAPPIAMVAVSAMIIDAVAHGVSVFDWPALVDQIAALAGEDPLMLGAQGHMEDVFPTRLYGPTQ